MKNNKIITYVELIVKPGFISEVLPRATKTRDIILLEEGCEAFNLTIKKDERNTIVIFAIYTSKELYDWHLQQDYIKTFFAFLDGKLISPPSVTYLEEV
jgi:quinol monooxygenase YgiN